MAQVPVSDSTYSRLHVLKAKAVIEKESSVTWDDVISAACDLCTFNKGAFIEAIKQKVGKSRTVVEVKEMVETKKDLKSTIEIKEAIDNGEAVTSEQLEKMGKPVRMKE